MLSLLVSVGAAPFVASAQSQAPLEQSARAILDRHCMACHGEAKTAGLDMRQRKTLLEGGKAGPAVIPGNADESLLYQAASHTGKLKMPPDVERLAAADLKVLQEWINQEELWRPPPAKGHIHRGAEVFLVVSADPRSQADRRSRTRIGRRLR